MTAPSRRALLVSTLALAACTGEIVPVDDPEDFGHPSWPDDAELDDDADVPLLPPINDDDAGELDGAVEVDAAAEADVPEETVAPRPDVTPPTDVAVARPDVVAARPDAPPPPPPPPPRCTGSASGQSSIWTCTSNRSARQRCVSGTVQTDACPHGCVRQPSGTNDYCASAPPPAPTTLPTCARRPLLHWGLHPDASDHLRCAGVPAARITQTIGFASASAGTHGPDGRAGGAQYSAATDISVRGLSSADIRTLLSRLGTQGFAAWYRWPGHDGWPSSEAPHIHAIYVGCAMKASLRSQVRSWLAGRNGLVSNTTYGFYSWTATQRAVIRAVFERNN